MYLTRVHEVEYLATYNTKIFENVIEENEKEREEAEKETKNSIVKSLTSKISNAAKSILPIVLDSKYASEVKRSQFDMLELLQKVRDLEEESKCKETCDDEKQIKAFKTLEKTIMIIKKVLDRAQSILKSEKSEDNVGQNFFKDTSEASI